MRSTIRQDGARALDDARLRRSVLLSARAEDFVFGADGPDAALCRRMAALPRMQARLFERIADLAGDPADCTGDLRQFLLLSPDARNEAALRAGLTYHLNAFGTAFSRTVLEALSAAFGLQAVRFALAHAGLSPSSVVPLNPAQDESRRLVLADGCRILALWLRSLRLADAWQLAWGDLNAASLTLVRPAACAIGAAVASAMAADREHADA
ncbi:hypothetical protein GGE07_005882 [Sinorhizobium terangae]|uniref:Uncharacterized protein n=1 Tax=Sinorhizobium terangae TaxID=110322 RepID=A0A6N7LK78_SINTE|nr:hypothetical protein [Sinorhizobium terangae]MBB4189201.1 hypothetical protein [Sinorhizobium terangae]MQX18271.1 hypothetical protein [Sinorhizobium terangae]